MKHRPSLRHLAVNLLPDYGRFWLSGRPALQEDVRVFLDQHVLWSFHDPRLFCNSKTHVKGSPYSITERRVPELIPVLGSQPAGDVSHKPGSRLPLLSARPAVTTATLKRAATNLLLGEQRHKGCEQFA